MSVDGEAVGLRARGPVGEVKNQVIVEVQPRETSVSNVVLWAWTSTNIRVKGDDTETLHVKFRDAEGGARLGAENVIEPVKGIDVNASYKSYGGPDDDDANGDFSVLGFTARGNTATIILKNTGNRTIWFTKVQVRGDAHCTYDRLTYTAEDAASQSAYSFGRPAPLSKRFQLPLTADWAQRLADGLLRENKDPAITYEMAFEVTPGTTLDELLAMEVMALIAVTDPASGLSSDVFRVLGVDGEVDALHRVTLTLERYVNPAPGYLIVGSATRGSIGTNLIAPY